MRSVYAFCGAVLFIVVFILGDLTATQVHIWHEDGNCINADCSIPCGEIKQFKRHQGCKK